jgi:diguanylate cyclase (GGDEF)-like protein
MNAELAFYAAHDPLTGLYNRRSFVEKMSPDSLTGKTERRHNLRDLPDCLILADIDHFKEINDHHGHAYGDKVLKEVAHRLEQTTRETDMVLRWGGEEFLIFSPNATPANITALVDRLLQAVAEPPIRVGDIETRITISAGFISLPFSGIPEEKFDWEKALNLADGALYLAKKNGRNRAYGLTKLLVPYEQAKSELESDLALAIENKAVDYIKVIGPSAHKAD